MSRIALLSYNNYYNRLFKIEDSLSAYLTAATSYTLLDNINFNPADGVTTSMIVGKGQAPFTTWESGSPDYLIVYKTTTEDVILSRWFILDEDRTRDGQWKISLRRDLLADFNEELATAPIYVEKGIIQDLDSPLLRNNEGLVVNQIKKEEILLKDTSDCPWLVMYIKKGVLGTTTYGNNGKISINVDESNAEVFETLNTPFTQWSMYTYITSDYNVLGHVNYHVYFKNGNIWKDYSLQQVQPDGYENGAASAPVSSLKTTTSKSSNLSASINREQLDNIFKPRCTTFDDAVKTVGFKSYNGIWKYNGKLIKDSNGKYYRITVYESNWIPGGWVSVTTSNLNSLKIALNNAWNAATGQTASANNSAFQINIGYKSYRIQYQEEYDIATTADFSAYTGNGIVDSELYDVIAMPYGTFQSWGQGGLIDVTSSKDRSLKVMNSIAAELTSNNVLDLQILPYCPCQEILDSRYRGRGFIKYLHDQCVTADDGQNYTDVIYVPSRLNFTLDIIEPINAMNFTSLSAAYLPEYCPDTYKVKYINDCTSLRLCSPNYNGMFEMNLAKNNMSVDFFNVDMTMRPYNPYIHMNPNFKGLYGQDFDDARGLICGGDFSLGIINDAWRQYEIQNKNYQAIFDRQIQNMDVNNAINKQEAWFQTGSGIMSGTVAGGAAGGVAGGGVGAAAGAILGAGASTLGGILDMQNLAARQKEARDFSIDNFNLQLGNIKALPYSITKTSALTANNKLFPFVEIYECTDVEKEAYFNKLTYDGFTLGVITHSFNDYRSSDNRNYFKGQLIRNTAIKGSTHEVNELAAEISKGVYI